MSTSRPPISRKRGLMRLMMIFSLLVFGTNLLFTASSMSLPGHLSPEAKPETAAKTIAGEQDFWAKVTEDIFRSNTLLPVFMAQAQQQEAIATYAASGPGQCSATPKTAFVLGDYVCAKATNLPANLRRSITWTNASGFVLTRNDLVNADSVTFQIPTSEQYVVNPELSVTNLGTWRVNLVPTGRSLVRASAYFTVTNPAHKVVDMSVYSFSVNESVLAGNNTTFKLYVENRGPDAAQNVQFTQPVPANATFVSESQDEGAQFTCTNPGLGELGTTTCTIASQPAYDKAIFTFVYKVDAGAAKGTVISTQAEASSTTTELVDKNNRWTASVTVTGSASEATCNLECPQDITTPANTEESGQPGAHVTYAVESSGDCGAITASHPSGSFFPVGTTTVSVTSANGNGSCTFNVTVTDANAPTISCPSNQEVNANSDCEANVVVGTPTATGNNVTISATRSDGKPMYNCDSNGANCTRQVPDYPFPAGVTTITWVATAHDSQGDDSGNASCTQTITVNDTTPPTITAPPGQTVSADENCQATVPDFTASATVSDNCACASSDNSESCMDHARITVTQSPAPGTVVGTGTHTITLTANDGSSNNGGAGNSSTATTTFTVNDTTKPVITINGANPMTVECHTSFTDPGATATDNCSGSVAVNASGSVNVNVPGTYTITYTATDAAGNIQTATRMVQVVDSTKPVITLNGQTITLWPPNHKYKTVNVTDLVLSASDSCDTSVNLSKVVISKVTSDETENGNGDGNTSNDIVIAANCKSVQLRSERDGGGNGRVYTITFRVRDVKGNETTVTSKVSVPQNQNGSAAIDSGVNYTVNGNCP